jgi:hypothetical protein|tara:strand:- start:653 stop:808 length:156 start_codon:yes stop_codon:yes gene_type:complete
MIHEPFCIYLFWTCIKLRVRHFKKRAAAAAAAAAAAEFSSSSGVGGLSNAK